ncbi:hypothetical protein AVEN_64404-1 [Araneus ventricosus]|uniref:Uncharacterized protein n=1 Tax=Araneus ventricosus TaxID=182803 RepID=A0A4Y2H5S0_ARAVE|nr:hypothetical protein AVEN_64404-1 [Araneus ventricosus]
MKTIFELALPSSSFHTKSWKLDWIIRFGLHQSCIHGVSFVEYCHKPTNLRSRGRDPAASSPWLIEAFREVKLKKEILYYSAKDSETGPFGRFYTGNGCQAMSHMSAFPEFFV